MRGEDEPSRPAKRKKLVKTEEKRGVRGENEPSRPAKRKKHAKTEEKRGVGEEKWQIRPVSKTEAGLNFKDIFELQR